MFRVWKIINIILENTDIEVMEAELKAEAEKKVVPAMRDLKVKACKEYKKQFFKKKRKADFKMCYIYSVC